jgi:hypothetical protein
MSEDYVNFVHGLGTDVESLRRERAWLIKRSKTHGLIDEEKKRLRLLGSDDASMSPSLIQPVQAAVDCGEARTPNFRDSKILSIPEKLEMMDLVKHYPRTFLIWRKFRSSSTRRRSSSRGWRPPTSL